jgi:hypothetical protein
MNKYFIGEKEEYFDNYLLNFSRISFHLSPTVSKKKQEYQQTIQFFSRIVTETQFNFKILKTKIYNHGRV